MKLWSEERDRLVKYTTPALAAYVQQRQLKLAEDQAAVVVDAIYAVFDELGIHGEERDRARRVAAERLRVLPSGGPRNRDGRSRNGWQAVAEIVGDEVVAYGVIDARLTSAPAANTTWHAQSPAGEFQRIQLHQLRARAFAAANSSSDSAPVE